MNLIDPNQRVLGWNGHRVSPVGFGTWRFTHDDVGHATDLLEAALDVGMNLVDCADVYGLDWGGDGFGSVESLLGRVLAERPELRGRMVLATKGGIVPGVPYDSSATHLRQAVDASLERLGVDRIDLYQIHRPDLLTHPREVADVLLDLEASGKVDLFGVSNHSRSQTEALISALEDDRSVATTQPEYSASRLDPIFDGTFDLCVERGITPLAWSPLAGGALATGDGVDTGLLAVIDRLAEREQVDRATMAVAFTLAHPSRPVALVGSQDPDRLATLSRATEVTLDRTDVYEIIQASMGEPLP